MDYFVQGAVSLDPKTNSDTQWFLGKVIDVVDQWDILHDVLQCLNVFMCS